MGCLLASLFGGCFDALIHTSYCLSTQHSCRHCFLSALLSCCQLQSVCMHAHVHVASCLVQDPVWLHVLLALLSSPRETAGVFVFGVCVCVHVAGGGLLCCGCLSVWLALLFARSMQSVLMWASPHMFTRACPCICGVPLLVRLPCLEVVLY